MTDSTTIPLRILCLHDGDSNAPKLKEALTSMGDRLYQKHSIDLVYVNSPLVKPSSSRNGLHADEQHRVWWEQVEHKNVTPNENENDPSSDSSTARRTEYRGLDASLMLLRQIWTSSPFWGIMGVGDGAAVASLLVLTLMAPPAENSIDSDDDDDEVDENNQKQTKLLPPPQFAIFVNGWSLLPEEERLIDIVPTLHLVPQEPSQNQERLIQQFGGTIHERSPRNPKRKKDENTNSYKLHVDDLNAIGRFIIEQKKNICSSNALSTPSSSSSREIVALQNALHLAETNASQMIAQHISQNPPAALMAIIQPQAVAGWGGSQPRRPEGTGGAPCPAEFLQRPNQRAKKSPNPHDEQASPVHPKSQDREHLKEENSK